MKRGIRDALEALFLWLCSLVPPKLATHALFLLRHRPDLTDKWGYHIRAIHYHEPLPDFRELSVAQLGRRREPVGIVFDLSGQLRRLEGLHSRFGAELRELSAEADGFYFCNPYFSGLDAALYYAIVRELKPARIYEIGGGYSTRIAASALAANAREGRNGVITVIEPYPQARLTAPGIEMKLIEERVEDNPFLDRFYEDMSAYRFQTQLVFLMNRYKQQLALTQKELFDDLTVIDYLFARDKIFAHVNLSDDELGLYNRIAKELEAQLILPDLVIYLQAASDVLFERIRNRGRALERTISKDYLETLNDAFNHFFFNYSETPLLVVNTDAMDFVNNERHFQDLLKRISEPVKGTELYVPSWEA